MNRKTMLPLLLGATLLFGCDDAPEEGRPSDAMDASTQPAPDGGADAADGPVARTGPVFGVVASDYTASAISLLDVKGEVLADDWLTSAGAAGLVTPLSGDVGLSSVGGEPGVVAVLDRLSADVLTRVRVADRHVLGQVKTHTPPAAGATIAFSSNPQDYLYVDPTTAWVSRYEPNLDPAVPAADRGTDLLRIDPSTMTRTTDRVDLSVFNTRARKLDPVTGQPTGDEVDVYARPSRITRVGDTLVVGLARLSFDFAVAGPGMVALVDLRTRAVRGFELPALRSCSEVQRVPDATDLVVVGCGGFLGASRATAGIALLRIADGAASQVAAWRASEHPADPVAGNGVVALGGSLVGSVAYGSAARPAMGDLPARPAEPDRFVIVDVQTGATLRELFQVSTPVAIGTGAYDHATGLLLVPDASVDANQVPTAGVRRFLRAADGSFSELPTVKVSTASGLPVRAVSPL